MAENLNHPATPPSKRIKLEPPSPPRDLLSDEHSADAYHEHDEKSGDGCSICLQPISDRTVIPICSHEFCFECLLVWTEQSRRCPLCSQSIGEYLIHNIRSKYDYQKHYLAPLRTSPQPLAARNAVRRQAQVRREREWGRRQRRAWEEADHLERAIERRRWVYRHNLYAKHVASNTYTRYRPFPTPAQFAADPALISRATAFLRRELNVWVGLDVEFLTTFTISLMKSLDIRSEPAVRLLAEFLDMDSGGSHENAEHFAHARSSSYRIIAELYCYLRSPYRELAVYDTVVQYDIPEGVLPPSTTTRPSRWEARDRSPSPAHSLSLSRSPSPPSRPHRRAALRSRSRNPSPPRSRAHSSREPDGRRDPRGGHNRRGTDRSSGDFRRSHRPGGRNSRSPSSSPRRKTERNEHTRAANARRGFADGRPSRLDDLHGDAPGALSSRIAETPTSSLPDRKGKGRVHLHLPDYESRASTGDEEKVEGSLSSLRPALYGPLSDHSHPPPTQPPSNEAVIGSVKADTTAAIAPSVDPSDSASGDQASGNQAHGPSLGTLSEEPRAQRQPRARNLLQELRAHLADRDGPPRVRRSHSGNEGPLVGQGPRTGRTSAVDNRGDRDTVSREEPSAAEGTTSLSSRLSIPEGVVYNASATEDLHRPYLTSVTSNHSVGGVEQSLETQATADRTPRTGGNLVSEPVRPSQSRSLQTTFRGEPHAAVRMSDVQERSEPSAASASALRSKLLSKLAQEKSKHDSLRAPSESPQLAGGSRPAAETVSMAVAASNGRSHGEVDDIVVGEQAAREAALRNQAQLRARLARAKLAANAQREVE